MRLSAFLVVAFGVGLVAALPARAAEFYVGEPVEREGLQIVPNYLVGIEMDRMPVGMEMGPDTVHLEADVHATKDEKHGFAEDAWIPYLTIRYTLTKEGGGFKKTAVLLFAVTAASARADDVVVVAVTIKGHRFEPPEIRVPAGKPVRLDITNFDPMAEEFDSQALKVEKVVGGGKSGSVRIRPLERGRYPFVGEYHADTAKGEIVAD